MKYPAAAVVQLTPKHGLRDCVLASLSAYLGKPYEEVVAAAGRVYPLFWRVGLENKHAIRVARRLGRRVRWVRDYDIDEDSGVLGITYNVGRAEHAVLLLEGRIFELEDKPINAWEPAAYLTANNARAGLLLVEVKR
jgi:hypothetical protein